jgi:penicillin-binding protein 1C
MKVRRKYLLLLVFATMLVLFWFSLPRPLFRDPCSTVLLDRNGMLLGARISADHQWRFPEGSKVPEKFREAVMRYEDRYFRYHPGINPVSMFRALIFNVKKGKIVSGGSTITMQVIRLARKNKSRTYFEKVIEIMLALRLELSYSKNEIMQLYAAHAPFGGNVVGLEAAAWRYFGNDPGHLSWAEAATLAVLPNSPGLIYPGRNPGHLLAKRNSLLDRLQHQGVIDEVTCSLAKSERLPEKPYALPRMAPQLLDRAVKEGHRGSKVVTTIDEHLQERVNTILKLHSVQLRANQIMNAAVLICEVNTGKVLAYVGNMPGKEISEAGSQIDIIVSPRSTGSILKPFLYASMLNDGLLLPNTLVADVPMQIGGFIPENFSLSYDGAVPAHRALARSLNIPAVKMLQQYGYDAFYTRLRQTGMTTLNKPADHYGLALILGGAEACLWDIAGIYGSMARTLNHFSGAKGKYNRNDFHPLQFREVTEEKPSAYDDESSWFDAASIWLTFEAMVEVTRPEEDLEWQRFSSSQKIAWKTGTSFGNRDAWSVGVTPEYIVAVWAGNASGEGRPGLTGIGTAAPVLFDIFKTLPPTTWFNPPFQAMTRIPVCRYSGYRASTICDVTDSMWIPKKGTQTAVCPYHQTIHLDRTGSWQVNASCESPENMQHLSWFVLPPVMEYYFRSKNPIYRMLPPFRAGCATGGESRNMGMIYPKNNSTLYVPVDLDGRTGSAVFKVAHRNPKATVYWHLDDRFAGSTSQIHQMAISPDQGFHRLTLIDDQGEGLQLRFEILTKDDPHRN